AEVRLVLLLGQLLQVPLVTCLTERVEVRPVLHSHRGAALFAFQRFRRVLQVRVVDRVEVVHHASRSWRSRYACISSTPTSGPITSCTSKSMRWGESPLSCHSLGWVALRHASCRSAACTT